jgi:isopentenyl phosphate kinase
MKRSFPGALGDPSATDTVTAAALEAAGLGVTETAPPSKRSAVSPLPSPLGLSPPMPPPLPVHGQEQLLNLQGPVLQHSSFASPAAASGLGHDTFPPSLVDRLQPHPPPPHVPEQQKSEDGFAALQFQPPPLHPSVAQDPETLRQQQHQQQYLLLQQQQMQQQQIQQRQIQQQQQKQTGERIQKQEQAGQTRPPGYGRRGYSVRVNSQDREYAIPVTITGGNSDPYARGAPRRSQKLARRGVLHLGPAMGQGRMPAGTSRAPVRSRSLNTERLNATAVNMLAEFLRTNHASLAPMAFEFWTIADVPLDAALADLFRSVHKPGIPLQHHNGPLDYSATTLKSYFSSLSRVFAANRPSPRGFHGEPFKSGVAVALEARIRVMQAENEAALGPAGRAMLATVDATAKAARRAGKAQLASASSMGANGRSYGRLPRAATALLQSTAKKARTYSQEQGSDAVKYLQAGQRGDPTRGDVHVGHGLDYEEDGDEDEDADDDDGEDEGGDRDGAGKGAAGGLSAAYRAAGQHETPIVPDNHFIMLWNAVSTGSDPVKHLLRLFLTAATLFGDKDTFLSHMRISDFAIETVADGEYVGRSALVLNSRMVANRAAVARQSQLAVGDASKLESPASTKAEDNKELHASSCGKTGLHYIVDMPEMGDGNNFYVLREYIDNRPPGAGDDFWLNCSRDRTSQREQFYSATVMSNARIGSLIDELYAETGISNVLGCLNHSLHLRIRRKVAGGAGIEAAVRRRRGRPRSMRPASRNVAAATAFQRAADRQASRSADGRSRALPPIPDVELIVKLGGAALTDKAKRRELAPKERYDGSIACVALTYKRGTRMIVCMGAGSYGHFEAKEGKVASGEGTTMGIAATHAAVSTLAAFVADALAKLNVPAIVLSPLLVSLGGATMERAVANTLAAGFVPVVHGDAMYNARTSTSSITSGDDLLSSLATSPTFPGIRRAVFVSDVAGVYAEPPSRASAAADNIALPDAAISEPLGADGGSDSKELPPAGLVRKIVVNSAGKVIPASCVGLTRRALEADSTAAGVAEFSTTQDVSGDGRGDGAPDVTGGMQGKLVCAGEVAGKSRGRITVYVVAAGSGSMTAAMDLREEPGQDDLARCTTIVYDGLAEAVGDGEGTPSSMEIEATENEGADGAAMGDDNEEDDDAEDAADSSADRLDANVDKLDDEVLSAAGSRARVGGAGIDEHANL